MRLVVENAASFFLFFFSCGGGGGGLNNYFEISDYDICGFKSCN